MALRKLKSGYLHIVHKRTLKLEHLLFSFKEHVAALQGSDIYTRACCGTLLIEIYILCSVIKRAATTSIIWIIFPDSVVSAHCTARCVNDVKTMESSKQCCLVV